MEVCVGYGESGGRGRQIGNEATRQRVGKGRAKSSKEGKEVKEGRQRQG